MNYVEYDESLHGKYTLPEGFPELLQGLSPEEQLDYFRIGNGLYLREPLADRRYNKYDYCVPVQKEERVQAVIVHDQRIVGVMVRNCHGKIVPCMAEKGFIIRDDSELDGSGYKTFRLYSYLICVTKDFDNI